MFKKKIVYFTMIMMFIIFVGNYGVLADDYVYFQEFNYPEGDFASGTDNFEFTHNEQGTSYVKIIKEPNGNTYLSIGKSANENGYSVSRDFSDIVAPFSSYIIEFKVKLNATNNNTSFNFYDGAHFNIGKSANVSQSKLEYHDGFNWIVFDGTFDLSDWCTFQLRVNKEKSTVDLYINGELIIPNVPKRYSSHTFGELTIIVNNSAIGSWDMDDLKVIGITSCSNEDYAYDDMIDFEDFGTGKLISGIGGIIFDNTQTDASVRIEYDAQTNNKFLTVSKTEAGNAFMVQRPYNSVVSEYSTYMVDYRFKINGNGLFAISDNSNFNNDGLSLSFDTNGTVSYISNGIENQLNRTINLDTWYSVRYVIHKESGTADLYFEGSLIERGIPAYDDSEFGALVITVGNSAIGSISVDDIIIRECGVYTGADWQQESEIDFENFSKGFIISGEGGIEFVEDYKAGLFAKIEYDEESQNKYLVIQKNTTNIGFSVRRTYTSLVRDWEDYAVSFRFKFNGTGTYNICESAGTHNRGILFNIANNGALKYFAGEGAPGAAEDGYITMSNKIDLSNWVTVRYVIHRATKTGDVYINGILIANNIPSRGNVDLGGLCITANNSVSGSLFIDDIVITKLDDYIKSNELLIELRTIHGYKGLTTDTIFDYIMVSDGVSVRILDGENEADGIIKKGMVLEAKHISGNTQVYTFGEEESMLSDIFYMNNGFVTEGKFDVGEITAQCSYKKYRLSDQFRLIIAQYDEEGRLMNLACQSSTNASSDLIMTKLDVIRSTGTMIKIMLWDQNLKPRKDCIVLEPYPEGYGNPTVSKENFDIFLALGQSNMAGRGKVEEQDIYPIPGAYLFNADDEWEVAQVQFVNNKWLGFNRYSSVKDEKKYQGLGPAVYFAKTLAEALSDTGREIGIVCNARGDTSIEQWQKGYAGSEDFNLYEEAVRRAKIAKESGTLKGIIWHQGCANVNSTGYIEKFIKFVTDLRNDLECPDLPIIVGEIAGFGDSEEKRDKRMNFIRNYLKELPKYVEHCYLISSAGNSDIGDKSHFDSRAQRKMGKAYAKSALMNIYGISQPQKELINIVSVEASAGSLNVNAAKDGVTSIYTWDVEDTYWSAPIGSYWIAYFEEPKSVSEIKSYFRNPWNYTYQYKIYTRFNGEWSLAVDKSQTYYYENVDLDGCVVDVLDNVLADAVKIEITGVCDIDGNPITSGDIPAACHEFEFR